MSSRSNTTFAAIRLSPSISTMLSASTPNRRAPGRGPSIGERVRARRSPRVAMTVDAIFATPRSARARMFRTYGVSTVSDAGIHDPTAVVGGGVVGQHSAIAAQLRAAKCAKNRSPTWLAAFSSAAPAAAIRRSWRARRRGRPRRRARTGRSGRLQMRKGRPRAIRKSKPSCEVPATTL